MPGAQAGAQISRVLAGPGSGKTRRLTQELQAQRAAGLPAASILGITFTRHAADELRERLSKDSTSDIPWVGTFHALARRIQVELKQLPDEINLDKLIPDANALLQKGTAPAWLRGLRFIGVDEAQDLDQSQVTFLNLMLSLSQKAELFLVGDPDQAIYGFRKASPNFLLFPTRYFTGSVRTIVLNENHRSAREIVTMAQAILVGTAHPDAPCRSLRAVRPEAHPAVRELSSRSAEREALRIFQEIRTYMAVGVPAHEIVILVRTRAQFGPLRAEAVRWNIPLRMPPVDDRGAGPRRGPAPPAADVDDTPAVSLLTIHQSKGSEWLVVFLAGCQTGLMPHTAAKSASEADEERRLLYVAVTRAKQLLWFSRYGDRSTYLPPPAVPLTSQAASSPSVTPRRSLWSRVCRLFSH